MHIYLEYLLKSFRLLFIKLSCTIPSKSELFEYEDNPELVSSLIYKSLSNDRPCMIARFGSNELNCIQNYLSVKNDNKNYYSYLKGEIVPWWWEATTKRQMHNFAGFFPPTENNLTKFSQLMLNDMTQVDILGTWLPGEKSFESELESSKKVALELLNPYFSDVPWTKALSGKKVLVVHPFSKTIESQYLKRDLLFKTKVLPTFELQTIKAVQSISGENQLFSDWFSALEYMKNEIDMRDYDICLIGCGAYGFPLAAHVKRSGKKAVHLGGSLQLLFGIIGKRWESVNYSKLYNYSNLINEHWVRPSKEETPKSADKVEDKCYW